MLEERGFNMRRVFTAVLLGQIASFISCRVAGFVYGLAWCAVAASTISNHADDVLSDGFVGASEFYLLSGRDLCLFYGLLVHEFLTDGD